jgi:hypothetical protein
MTLRSWKYAKFLRKRQNKPSGYDVCAAPNSRPAYLRIIVIALDPNSRCKKRCRNECKASVAVAHFRPSHAVVAERTGATGDTTMKLDRMIQE